jgi:hypothetical protein
VPGGIASRDFITAVRALVTAAREHGDALAPHGAPPELIDRAAALLDQYVTATRDGRNAVSARVEEGRGDVATGETVSVEPFALA